MSAVFPLSFSIATPMVDGILLGTSPFVMERTASPADACVSPSLSTRISSTSVSEVDEDTRLSRRLLRASAVSSISVRPSLSASSAASTLPARNCSVSSSSWDMACFACSSSPDMVSFVMCRSSAIRFSVSCRWISMSLTCCENRLHTAQYFPSVISTPAGTSHREI